MRDGVDEITEKDQRMGGIALIAAAVGGLVTMTIHPTGEQLLAPGHFSAVALMGVIAHTLAIASMPVGFLGALALTRRLASPDRLSLVALVTYGFAIAAGMIAATISGFVAGPVAREMIAAAGTDGWAMLFRFSGMMNQAFAQVLVVASCAAIILWSAAMLRTRVFARGVAVYGLVVNAIVIVAVFSGQLRLHVAGFGVVVLVQSIWFVIVGSQMYGARRRARSSAIGAFALAVLLVLLGMHLVHAAHGHPRLTQDKMELSSSEVTLPMERFQNRPTVRVMIDGKGPYRFIFDSGAMGNVIDPALAEQLKLESQGEIRLGSPLHPEGTVTKILLANRLSVGSAGAGGGLELSGVRLISSALPQFPGNEPDVPVGVLSPLFFEGYLVGVDYPKNLISIRKGELAAANGQDIFEYQGRLPRVPLAMAGKNIEVTVDSGDRRGLSLPEKYKSEVPLAGAAVAADPIRMVGGMANAVRGTLKGTAVVGRYGFDNPEITFVEALPFGDIGSAALSRFVVTFDPGNRRVRIVE